MSIPFRYLHLFFRKAETGKEGEKSSEEVDRHCEVFQRKSNIAWRKEREKVGERERERERERESMQKTGKV